MDLRGARMLITGGSAGIGLAIAERCRERGARLALNGRDRGRLDDSARRLGAAAAPGDVGVEAEAREVVARTVAALGGLDVLVNNAAWGFPMELAALDAGAFEGMWRSNVLGAALMARECLPHLEASGRGAVVNIGSTAGRKGYAGGSAYAATKFALRGLTECWQAELRPRDIRVILVNPSEVQTGFGGRPLTAPPNPHKLIAADVAHAVVTALEMDDRGFIPELTIFATNPWKDA